MQNLFIIGSPRSGTTFLASLLIASLPVTGTLLWYGKKYKKKKKPKRV